MLKSVFVRHVNMAKYKKLKSWAAENNLHLYQAVNLAFERVVQDEYNEKKFKAY